MKEIFEQQRASGFPDFVGSDLTVRLPVPDRIVNEVIQAVVFKRGPKAHMTSATVRFHSDNRFTIDASTDLAWPLPKNVSINGAFAPTTDFAKDPRLLILLAPSAVLGLLLKLFAGVIEEKAPFLSLSDNRLFVDVPMLLAKAGAADYVPLLQTIRMRSVPGTLTVELNAHVNPK